MKQSKWMWKYGEFEVYHHMMVHTRRTEFGTQYPSIWSVDGVSPWVEFSTNVETDKPGYINAKVNAVVLHRGREYLELGIVLVCQRSACGKSKGRKSGAYV